jgi:hypothetical protein
MANAEMFTASATGSEGVQSKMSLRILGTLPNRRAFGGAPDGRRDEAAPAYGSGVICNRRSTRRNPHTYLASNAVS